MPSEGVSRAWPQRAPFTQEKNGDVSLDLATAGRGCKYSSAGDFGIALKFDKDKKGFRHAWFRGDMMASNDNASHEALGKVAIGPEKGGKVPVVVSYEREAFGFKVKVEGEVSALKCDPKK